MSSTAKPRKILVTGATGRCQVNWRDGLARMVAELKAADAEKKEQMA